MKETPEKYSRRLLGYVHGERPLDILTQTEKKIRRMTSTLTARQLTKRIHPKKWSIAEIMAHLAETEIVLAWRYRSIVERNAVRIQPFDQDLWEKNSQYHRMNFQDSLTLFSAVRKANLAFLKKLSRAQWKRYGIHEERGRESIERIVALEAGHDINHCSQIKMIISYFQSMKASNGTR